MVLHHTLELFILSRWLAEDEDDNQLSRELAVPRPDMPALPGKCHILLFTRLNSCAENDNNFSLNETSCLMSKILFTRPTVSFYYSFEVLCCGLHGQHQECQYQRQGLHHHIWREGRHRSQTSRRFQDPQFPLRSGSS